MKNMTLKEIAVACGGVYYGDDDSYHKEVSGVTIDSRKIESDYLFIPIRGARVDGHMFIPQVISDGALCSLSEQRIDHADYPYILVDSCKQALKDIAAHYRRSLNIKVVGITGSVGKTSTKEMIASVLSQKYSVLKTEGNFNNEIGLPLTVFQIRKEHQVAVLEMGISMFGEMEELTRIAGPDICVFTNIGPCHLEHLGSLEGVLKAKIQMISCMQPDGSVIMNGDDALLASVHLPAEKNPLFFGMTTERDVYATDAVNLGLKGSHCTIHSASGTFEAHIPMPGAHMVYNALAGASVGLALSLTPEEIQKGIESLTPVSGRGQLIETAYCTIIDDCYNANPVSMKASIDVLSQAQGYKAAILGSMFELGKDERRLHYEVGQYAAAKGIDLICCIGELGAEIARGADNQTATILTYEEKDMFIKEMGKYIPQGASVLVKASHGMNFPVIVDALKTL